MPHNAVNTLLDDNGYTIYPVSTASIASASGTTTVKNGAGRLAKVLVTVAATTGVVTIYDSVGVASGTVLGVVPASTAAGTIYDLQMPAQSGITVVAAASSAGITVSYS